MAAESGQSGARLIERLVADPASFELFAAARIVEDEAARIARAEAEEPPPEVGGQEGRAGRGDPVRFAAAVMLGFPGAAVVAARHEPAAGAGPASAYTARVRLEVATFGLIGPGGVLPRHYTALVLERVKRFRDRALREFLDLFTHRAISLLVRAWGKYRIPAQRARLTTRGQGPVWDESPVPRDATSVVLSSLIGLGGKSLPGRLRGDEQLLLHHAGHLSRQPAAALPLEQMVADIWGVAAVVEQFTGQWLELEPADQTRLGTPANGRLGVDAMAGRRVWSVEAAYCVRLGPLTWAEFTAWLPTGDRLGALSDLLTFHVGPTLEATVRPVLRADDVPATRLGGAGASRLGWTTWLISRQPVQHADDAAFRVTL
jgi:type VI secretion system protein ImpH